MIFSFAQWNPYITCVDRGWFCTTIVLHNAVLEYHESRGRNTEWKMAVDHYNKLRGLKP